MKRALRSVSVLFLTLTLAGCTAANPAVSDTKEETVTTSDDNAVTSPADDQEDTSVSELPGDNQEDTAPDAEEPSYRDPKPDILEELANKDVQVPTLNVTGDRWPYEEETLQELWKYYYPYMEVVFGPIADDFWEQGLTWNMTDETLERHCCEQYADDNRIDIGDDRALVEFPHCAASLVHETGHIWLQNNNTALQFECGQWLWEANTLLFEEIATIEGLDPDKREGTPVPNYLDLYDYAGGDVINGVLRDGDKANAGRSYVDGAANLALFYLDTALSTPGTYDYWQKVCIARTEYAKENNVAATDPEALSEIMDRVADGKTMDGMKPSEWLFSRSVADTEGSDGVLLGVFGHFMGTVFDQNGNVASPYGRRAEVTVYGAKRTNGVEEALEGTEVRVAAYDCFGNEIASQDVTISDRGDADGILLRDKDGNPVEGESFPEYSVIRFVATADVDGQEYTDVNFFLNTSWDDLVYSTDNRLFFLLINEDETVNTSLTDIEVSGGYNVDKSHLDHGLLIVQAAQGESVIVNGKEYTKPLGARLIPIVVE